MAVNFVATPIDISVTLFTDASKDPWWFNVSQKEPTEQAMKNSLTWSDNYKQLVSVNDTKTFTPAAGYDELGQVLYVTVTRESWKITGGWTQLLFSFMTFDQTANCYAAYAGTDYNQWNKAGAPFKFLYDNDAFAQVYNNWLIGANFTQSRSPTKNPMINFGMTYNTP